MPSQFVSVADAALQIGICHEEVRKLILRGALQAVQPQRKWLILRVSLENWIALQSDAARAEAQRRSGLDYLKHWDHTPTPTIPTQGGRGTRAVEGALAVLRGGAADRPPKKTRKTRRD